MDENQELQQQFLQLLSIAENMQQRIVTLEKSNEVLLKSQRQFAKWMNDTLAEISHYRENVYYELMDPRNTEEKNNCWYPRIASREETLSRIIEKGASIGRFGDGEFSTIAGRIRHNFQTVQDVKLADRLKEVLQSEEDGFLVAIADNYGSLHRYTEQAKREIRYYMTSQVRKEHLALLKQEHLYYDTHITRPYVMFADNQTDAPRKRFEQLRQIWDQRDCIFVEGCMTGLGVGNNLFDNAHSIRRILAPAENAFSQYDKIMEYCRKQPENSLFLLALGPTATVLAYDLFRAGYQAVDIGHVDLEYEWFLRGEGRRTPVTGKYNNEVADGNHPRKIRDSLYQSQIIADISQ